MANVCLKYDGIPPLAVLTANYWHQFEHHLRIFVVGSYTARTQ